MHSICLLGFKVTFEHAYGCRRDDEKIAALSKIDRGGLSINRHLRVEALKERNAVVRECDILRERKQSPYATRCARRRRQLIACVALNDSDTTRSRMGSQEVGGGGSDCTTTDNRDVNTHGSP
jgi:hypothetical protein